MSSPKFGPVDGKIVSFPELGTLRVCVWGESGEHNRFVSAAAYQLNEADRLADGRTIENPTCRWWRSARLTFLGDLADAPFAPRPGRGKRIRQEIW